MLKSAFNQVDMELELQKDLYEEKMEKLNDQISKLKLNQQNALTSDEVKKHMEKKDKEIQELYKIIDEYSASNKMIETLSE